jgi:hypothetical protein
MRKRKTDTKDQATTPENGPVWEYYRINFKLIREMLGTCTEASIMKQHVIEKAKKQIKKANRLGDKISKALDKFIGSEITEEKEIKEIQGVIRTFAELTGKPTADPLPTNMNKLLKLAEQLEEEFNELVRQGEEQKSTVFMRMPKNGDPNETWPVISTHMILGNLKENLKIIVNNEDKTILKTKVSVGETLALDVKAIEEFMFPTNDIVRDEEGNRILLERPILFSDAFGKKVTAIGSSEQLPPGTEFGCVLRVRKNSPIDENALRKLFTLGRNNGFGSWRGSGNRGAYWFKLEKLKDYQEFVPEGWE